VTPVLLEISRVFPRFVFSQDGEMMGDAVRWVNDMGSYRRGRSARDHRHSPTPWRHRFGSRRCFNRWRWYRTRRGWGLRGRRSRWSGYRRGRLGRCFTRVRR